jgi:hypothetical protein
MQSVHPRASQGQSPLPREEGVLSKGCAQENPWSKNTGSSDAEVDGPWSKDCVAKQGTQHFSTQMEMVRTSSQADFFRLIDEPENRPTLHGKNVLGVNAWRAFGCDVGDEPPIPAAFVRASLNPDFRDNFLLVLVPESVNGEPYTPLVLDQLSKAPYVGGSSLIYRGWDWWKSRTWAATPQTSSEWVLLPLTKPDVENGGHESELRGKSVAQQERIQAKYYGDYRQAKTIEVITAAILDTVVNGEARILANGTHLRAVEPSSCGGQVTISLDDRGIKIADFYVGLPHRDFDRALAGRG